jgi:sigma-B regulation protein RsbU (phosphoserine phosphatase)
MCGELQEAVMTTSPAQLVQFLQQENGRLQKENELLQEENRALHRYIDALKDLYSAAQRIMSEENLLDLLDEILYNAMVVLRAEDGSLLLLDEETDELVFAVVHGDIRGELRGYRISGDIGIAGWVATEGESLIVDSPRQDWRFSPQIDEAFGFVTRSILCVPMITRGKLIGVIELLNKYAEKTFTETDATLLSILAQIAATALDDMRSRFEAEENVALAQSR